MEILPVNLKLRKLLLRRPTSAAGSLVVYCVSADSWSHFACIQRYCLASNKILVHSTVGMEAWSMQRGFGQFCVGNLKHSQQSNLKRLARWKAPVKSWLVGMKERRTLLRRTRTMKK